MVSMIVMHVIAAIPAGTKESMMMIVVRHGCPGRLVNRPEGDHRSLASYL
jgi:hypothetical protein